MKPDPVADLRTASPADLEAIRFVDPLMRADPDRASLIQESLKAGECTVAVDGEEVVGYAILNYSFFNQGFVPLIVVAQANRRCGVGVLLMAELERRCKKPKIFVSANRSNLPAQWLFEKRGFVESGVVQNLDLENDEVLFFKVPNEA